MLNLSVLTAPERRLWDAIENGELVDFGDGQSGGQVQAEEGANWGADRTINAHVLIAVLTDRSLPNGRVAHAVRLRSARVVGALNLDDRELSCPLELMNCYLDEPLRLQECRSRRLTLRHCVVPAVFAGQLSATAGVDLEGTKTRTVVLSRARISGVLDIRGAEVSGRNGEALFADGIHVEGDMILDGLKADAEMRLIGAHVDGQLENARRPTCER